MKKQNLRFTFVVVGLVMAFMLSASAKIAGEPDVQRISFTEWMLSLPEETRVQVEGIFQENLNCLEKGHNGTAPYNWKEQVYFELQAVVTPQQFSLFTKIVEGKQQSSELSGTASSCNYCNYARARLSIARSRLASALAVYDSSYCDFGIGDIDKVYIYISLAHYYTDKAYDEAVAAYATCDCTSAQNAKDYNNTAKGYLVTAIQNTSIYCDNTPWETYLDDASTYLSLATFYLNKCVDETCN